MQAGKENAEKYTACRHRKTETEIIQLYMFTLITKGEGYIVSECFQNKLSKHELSGEDKRILSKAKQAV